MAGPTPGGPGLDRLSARGSGEGVGGSAQGRVHRVTHAPAIWALFERLLKAQLPALKEPEPPPRTTKDPCLDAPPPYKVAKAPAPQA